MADIEITSQVLTPARSDADRYFAITFGSAYALDPAKHMVVKVHSYCPTGTYQENGDHSYLPSVVCPASGDLLESSVVHDRVEILSAGTPVWGS
jgi:hypothetical protein